MKQSEPANPRSLLSQRNADGAQGSAIAAEISGYADIGMKREALRLARQILEKRRILPDEFSEAMQTIGMYLSSKTWKAWKHVLRPIRLYRGHRRRPRHRCLILQRHPAAKSRLCFSSLPQRVFGNHCAQPYFKANHGLHRAAPPQPKILTTDHADITDGSRKNAAHETHEVH